MTTMTEPDVRVTGGVDTHKDTLNRPGIRGGSSP
jgi:hypothetical protein